MHIKTPDELQAIADDLHSTANSLAVMLDPIGADSHLMKDVFLRWPLMIHDDAADKLAPQPRPWDGLPVWPEEHASENEIWMRYCAVSVIGVNKRRLREKPRHDPVS